MKTLCVLLLCILHIANSQIFPIGQVIEYDYEAFVQVATEYPSLHTSEFLINAKLHITGISNGAFVSFKDVTHTVYTGKGDNLYTDSNRIGLDQESQLLMDPFVIMYDRSGKVESILTDRSDMPWSVNIKKAIASLLQIDVPEVIYGKTNGFYTNEQTVHGNCRVQYAVTPGSSGNLKVFKHHNTYSCEEFKFDRFLNLFSPRCDNRRGEVLTVSSERFYDIKFMRDELDIHHIESFNSIIFNPFYNNDQNIFVNQTLHKLSKRELNEELRFDVNDMIPHRLKNEVMNFDMEEEIYDISGGRQFVNQELVMQKAIESLKNIFNYIHQNHILLTEAIKDQKQGMNFLFHQIKLMNLQTLDHFYKTISEEKGEDTEDLVELFLQALPFAGSYPSTIFIRDLIMESKVSDEIAFKMLRDVPFYVKNINKKVLGEFFELLKGKDLSNEVMKSTLLTFASMVNLGVDRYGENDVDIENYIYFYLDKFEQARDQESQTLFIHTLKNLGTNKVAFYLENLLTVGRPGIYLTPHSKVQAMWAIRSKLIQHPGKVSTMFWPMLVDQHESFEVRATALQILLITATTSSHMKIYWFMQSVNDYDLHNYYYTVLVESAKFTGSCYDTNMQRATNMLRFVRKPRNLTISQTLKLEQLANLFDAYYGFGLFNQILPMGNLATKGFVWIDAQQSPQVEDMESIKQSMQFYIKISENLQKLIRNRQTDIDINQLFTTSMKPDDLELEIVKVRRGRIVSVTNYNMETMHIAYEKFKERHDSSKGIVNFEIDQFVGEEILIPTDLGVPVSLFYQMPAMKMSKIHFEPGQADKGTINWKFTYDNFWWYQHKTGLAVYNPVANLWHGSRRVLTLDVHLPIDIYTTLGSENSIKMTLNKDGEQNSIKRGFQSHVHNHMFMFSDNNGENIKKMCAECQPITIVTDRENIHNTEILSENKVGDVKYEHALFDCERNITTNTGMAFLKDKFTSSKMNIFTAMKYWRVYDRIFADRGMCGIGLWYEMHGKTSNAEKVHDTKKNDVFCEIENDYVIDIRNAKVNDKISSDWKFYAGECDRTCKWSISVKKVEGDKFLGVQLKHLNDVVEIYPQQGYQVSVNGKMLKHLTTGYFDGSWFNYKVLGQENMLILRAKNVGVQIQHDGNSIKLSLPEKLDNSHTGLCYGVSKLALKV